MTSKFERDMVTTLELLSPFNKKSSTPGQEAFLRKRETVHASNVHWLEIDLLRAGKRPPEVRHKNDYYVSPFIFALELQKSLTMIVSKRII